MYLEEPKFGVILRNTLKAVFSSHFTALFSFGSAKPCFYFLKWLISMQKFPNIPNVAKIYVPQSYNSMDLQIIFLSRINAIIILLLTLMGMYNPNSLQPLLSSGFGVFKTATFGDTRIIPDQPRVHSVPVKADLSDF